MGIFIAIIFVISFIVPPGVFAQIQQNEDMEKKCKATREGTETDQETKKACAGYFEQTGAAGAAGASAGAAASTGMGAGTIAAIVVGVAAAGAVVQQQRVVAVAVVQLLQLIILQLGNYM